MAVESGEFTELGDEFALIAETAAETGTTPGGLPRVRRGWVNVPAGGHVSGVFWGDGPPEVVLHRRQPRLVPRLALVSTLPGSAPGPAQGWPGPERFASRAEALAALAVRRPEHSPQALRREILHELIQDQDGSWAWRHHPGQLPPASSDADDEALWKELGQLGPAAALVRSDWAGPLSAADLARLHERAPGVQVITIPGGGADVVAAHPAALAAALDQLLTTEPERQR